MICAGAGNGANWSPKRLVESAETLQVIELQVIELWQFRTENACKHFSKLL